MSPYRYVPASGSKTAKIFIVGEAPGAEEDKLGLPFTGSGGQLLDKILYTAGISKADCFFTYVAKIRPKKDIHEYYEANSFKPLPELAGWIDELKNDIREVNPKIIIALGTTALRHLTNKTSIEDARGATFPCTLVSDYTVLATYNPGKILRDWDALHPAIADFKKVSKILINPSFAKHEYILDVDVTLDKFEVFARHILSDKSPVYLSFDIETSEGEITWIGFSCSPLHAINIKILKSTNNSEGVKGLKIPIFNLEDETRLWLLIKELLTAPHIRSIAQNAQYDMSILYTRQGILCTNLWMDTMIAAHVCFPGTPKDLESLTAIATCAPQWKFLAAKDMGTYNALDVVHTLEVATFLDEEINFKGVKQTFDFEMSLISVAMMLGLQGVKVNPVIKQTMKDQAKIELEEIIEKINMFVPGQDVNWNSPAQVQKILYFTLNLPVQFARRKSINDPRKISTDEKALNTLIRTTSHPFPKLFLEYRKLSKAISSFYDCSLSPDNRIYTTYNIAGTDTGRWSSSQSIIFPFGPGNNQNIPKKARKFIVAEEGMVFVQGDLVQAEAVVVAYLCNDVRLKQAFANGEDVHKLTAAMMFRKPVEEITKAERTIGKTIRHACNYSAGPTVLSDRLQCSLVEAKKFMELYKRANPMLSQWHESIKMELGQSMTLVTPLGRKRRFVERWGDDLFRSAFAHIPQSTVGDLTNIALLDFYNKFGDSYIISLQVHDAIVIQCLDNPEAIQQAKDDLKSCMVRTIVINRDPMTIDVDFKVGKSWGDMEE